MSDALAIIPICGKCGEVHPGCTGHPHLSNSPDGQYHPCTVPRHLLMPNGNCRAHGGASLKGIDSPSFKHGKRSAYFNDVKGKRRKILEASTPELNRLPSVIDETGIMRMRLHELMTCLDESTLLENWKEILRAFSMHKDLIVNRPDIEVGDDMKDPDAVYHEMLVASVQGIFKILTRVSHNERVSSEIADTVERLRKLRETDAKLRAANIVELEKVGALVPQFFITDLLNGVAEVLQQSPDDIRERQMSDLKAIFMRLPGYIREPKVREE